MRAAGELRKLTPPANVRRADILRIKFLSCKQIVAGGFGGLTPRRQEVSPADG
jgi:hypothetical protein